MVTFGIIWFTIHSVKWLENVFIDSLHHGVVVIQNNMVSFISFSHLQLCNFVPWNKTHHIQCLTDMQKFLIAFWLLKSVYLCINFVFALHYGQNKGPLFSMPLNVRHVWERSNLVSRVGIERTKSLISWYGSRPLLGLILWLYFTTYPYKPFYLFFLSFASCGDFLLDLFLEMLILKKTISEYSREFIFWLHLPVILYPCKMYKNCMAELMSHNFIWKILKIIVSEYVDHQNMCYKLIYFS